MRALLLIMLLMARAQAQLGTDATPNQESDEAVLVSKAQVDEEILEKYREQIKKLGNECKAQSTPAGLVRVGGPSGDLAIEIVRAKKVVAKKYLPSFGTPSQKCLHVDYFPENGILVYRVYKGQSSPAAIEVYSLGIAKIVDKTLSSVKEFVLLDYNQDGESENVKTYRIFKRDGDLILELNNRTLSPPVIEEHILNHLQF